MQLAQHIKQIRIIFRYTTTGYLIFFWLFISFLPEIKAEGTKQLMPYDPAGTPKEITELYFDNGLHRVPFAQIGCASQYRLNVYIADPATEKIYLGLNDDGENLYYQVRDPNGMIVPGFALAAIPVSRAGYIANWSQASNGPNISGSNPAGYTKIFTPVIAGDYYIKRRKTQRTISG